MRFESETAMPVFLVFLFALQVFLGTPKLSLFFVHRSGCSLFFAVTPAEKFVSPLSVSSPSPRKR